ncbi:hypothetical protein ACLEJQ_22375 [Pseudomonas sp. SMV71]|uniref:hypothetical protein n=1 Tax=Pseudomonas sp. SMV71 TaxID=3390195 RepID=UPI003F84237B
MSFNKIPDAQFDLTRNAAYQAGRVKSHAVRLSKAINELLNSEYPAEEWGTSCLVGADGITLRIRTPFGDARAVTAIQLINGYVGARYVFEKLIASNSGTPFYQPVWAIRIDGEGQVTSDDGELLYRLQAFSGTEREHGVVTVTLSAIYAIATNDGYYVSDQ